MFLARREENLGVQDSLKLTGYFSGSSTGGSPEGFSFLENPREPNPSGSQAVALRSLGMETRQFGVAYFCLILCDFFLEKLIAFEGDRVRGDQPPFQPGSKAESLPPSPLCASPLSRGGTHVHPTFFLFLLQSTFSLLCRQSSREGPG